MSEFSVDDFRDEVRCGFYIPTAVKQAWAAELEVLAEIDRICEKHGIRYFADWGTILGAVRHGGFVPWDDDLDVCMLRDDYIRFRQVADAELPQDYVIHDYARQEDHWLFLARVVNHQKICFAPEYLDAHHNFPWLVGVDIFVKDYLYEDPVKEKERDDEIMHILAVADGIVAGSIKAETGAQWLQKFREKYGFQMDAESDPRQQGIALYRLAEEQMARVAPEETDTIGQIFPFILKGGQGQPKKYYEDILRIPFENTTIPVPASYDTILRSRYGDYLKIHKVWGGHGYPFFEGQKAELLSHADFAFPEYRFDCSLMQARDASAWQEPHRRKVLFLATGPMWWEGLAERYRQEREQPDTDVFVIALPMLFKNCCGEIAASDAELVSAARESEYPEELIMAAWYDVQIEKELPDRVYFQDVYDGENPCLCIPPMFYASYVRNYTKELILVPPFCADDFGPQDRNDVYGMKHYVTSPGVACADRVLLQSETIRQRYLEALTDWAGEDTRAYWEQKLQVPDREKEKISDRQATEKKTILFMIGANEAAEYKERAAELLQKKLDVLQEKADTLDVLISLYPPEPEAWELCLKEVAQSFLAQVEKALDRCGYCDLRENSTREIVSECDAYYGSASPLVVEFVRAGKPVMIADYRV